MTSTESTTSVNGGQMVSIAVAERETGVGKDTLRVWERRYGFPRPVRDARGDRLYPREQIARLRLMKRLMDSGHRPGKIAAASDEDLLVLSGGHSTVAAETARDQAVEPLPQSDELDALRCHDAAAFRSLLSQQLARIGLEQFVTETLPRLNAQIGNEWAGGHPASPRPADHGARRAASPWRADGGVAAHSARYQCHFPWRPDAVA
jgi:DNA-binding transcriptional MerR regulator